MADVRRHDAESIEAWIQMSRNPPLDILQRWAVWALRNYMHREAETMCVSASASLMALQGRYEMKVIDDC